MLHSGEVIYLWWGGISLLKAPPIARSHNIFLFFTYNQSCGVGARMEPPNNSGEIFFHIQFLGTSV
jgi:hypothetical protein